MGPKYPLRAFSESDSVQFPVCGFSIIWTLVLEDPWDNLAMLPSMNVHLDF